MAVESVMGVHGAREIELSGVERSTSTHSTWSPRELLAIQGRAVNALSNELTYMVEEGGHHCDRLDSAKTAIFWIQTPVAQQDAAISPPATQLK